MALTLMAKAFKLNYSKPTNNDQRISSNPKNRQIAQPGMNMGQDRQMQMVGGNGGNQFRQYAGNPAGYNDVIGNLNQIGNGNIVAAHAEGNAAGQNGNQIRCYNCRGVEEYDLMAAAADLDEIEEVNANCILMANLQQASTSGTQTDSAPVYDSDGSAEDTSVEQGGETVEQHPANFEETRALYESLYQNLAIEPDSFYHTEQKMALGYQNPFYLKQAQKKQQSLYDVKVLLEKHDPPVVHDSKETLQIAQESREKMKQLNKEIKLVNYTKINHLSGVFVPQTALSREELFFSNNSKTTTVSKSISIPNKDFSDDTTPSVARKFLNEVKSTIVTLQHVIKHGMTIETHNWSSSAHQELHKIVREENFPIVNQVDARVQNFEIQFLKEAAKFVGDFKSLANEADVSLAKHKALELEIERLLKAVVIQDIMIIIERLQAQLGDLKGKSKDTSCVSDTRNSLSQILENENVELEFQVLNYARENAHLKATYKNLFDSISVSHNTQDTSENTKFAKQPIVKNLPKVGETNALSKPVTSNSVSTPQESKSVNNDK
nr:hypothetical protein [Tanacetum cinerariifolium]